MFMWANEVPFALPDGVSLLVLEQEQPRRKSQTLNFTEEGFPVVRPLGQSKVQPVNDTQENYDNSGACYACVKQSTGPTPAWLKFDRQVSTPCSSNKLQTW